MLKIAVIGGRETVMGFKALGLETRPAANADEARRILHTLARSEEDYAIIYVEETFAADGDMAREIARYKDLPKPAVILIPAGKALWDWGSRPFRRLWSALWEATSCDVRFDVPFFLRT